MGKSILPNHAYAQDKQDRRILLAFRSLEKIDPDATYTEIVTIAKDRFGEHPHADKWTELCFLLRRDEKGTISELRRFAELEIRMLTDLNVENHTEQIQQHRQTLKKHDQLIKTLKSQGKNPDTVIVDF